MEMDLFQTRQRRHVTLMQIMNVNIKAMTTGNWPSPVIFLQAPLFIFVAVGGNVSTKSRGIRLYAEPDVKCCVNCTNLRATLSLSFLLI